MAWKHIRTQDSSSVEDEGGNMFGTTLNIKQGERTTLGANCQPKAQGGHSARGVLKRPLCTDGQKPEMHQLGQELGEDPKESSWRLSHPISDLLCNVGDPVDRVSALVNLMKKLAFNACHDKEYLTGDRTEKALAQQQQQQRKPLSLTCQCPPPYAFS